MSLRFHTPTHHTLAAQAALRFNHYVVSGAVGGTHKPAKPAVTTIPASNHPTSIKSQLATIALLKLPLSFLFTSGINGALFKIPFIKSAGLELLGIAIEAVGMVSITAAKKYYDTHDDTPDTHTSHEKMLKIAGAGVSLVSSTITISRCIAESDYFKRLTRTHHKVLRVLASVAAGTLCGTLEGYLAGKVTPWLEKQLAP